ncbi:hypothetical protein PR048_008904 [Dryococelus australis]|uniref:Uncharacterized protein n=1 Tax=Dryococelus australis TaxID=614101 RepID=A0ABQ9HZH7_9NEOP|nr:hypothetical protein PR048_008904 [Dryococelus australis]
MMRCGRQGGGEGGWSQGLPFKWKCLFCTRSQIPQKMSCHFFKDKSKCVIILNKVMNASTQFKRCKILFKSNLETEKLRIVLAAVDIINEDIQKMGYGHNTYPKTNYMKSGGENLIPLQ